MTPLLLLLLVILAGIGVPLFAVIGLGALVAFVRDGIAPSAVMS